MAGEKRGPIQFTGMLHVLAEENQGDSGWQSEFSVPARRRTSPQPAALLRTGRDGRRDGPSGGEGSV